MENLWLGQRRVAVSNEKLVIKAVAFGLSANLFLIPVGIRKKNNMESVHRCKGFSNGQIMLRSLTCL